MGHALHRSPSEPRFVLQHARGPFRRCRGRFPLEHSQAAQIARGILDGDSALALRHLALCERGLARSQTSLQASGGVGDRQTGESPLDDRQQSG
jgi:hypothetical protein